MKLAELDPRQLTTAGLGLGSHRPAVIAGGAAVDFARLEEQVASIAHALTTRGFLPGHRIAIHMDASSRMLSLLFGALRCGLMATVLSPRLGAACIRRRLEQFAPDLVLQASQASPGSAWSPSREPREGASSLVLWTSGTSGRAKGMVLDARAVMWNATVNARELGLDANDRALVLLDASYCYALVAQIMSHLLVGAAIALPAHPLWLDASGVDLEEAAVTTLAVVPSMLRAVLASSRMCARLRHLRLITIGGASVSPELLGEAHRRFGCAIAVTYGLTEAGPRVTTHHYDALRGYAPGAVGVPLPGVEVRVDEGGELLVRSPSARRATVHPQGVTAAHEWIRTGDLGEVAADGEVFVRGRIKPVLVRNGTKIGIGEIEDVLCAHPAVSRARVVAVRQPRVGEVPHAIVQPRGPAPTKRELAEHCLRELGRDWVPVSIDIVEDLGPAGSWKDAW